MNLLKNLISGFKREDYYSRINLHIHSNFSDGIMPPEEIIKKALQCNLEYISITDHNSVEAYNCIAPEKIPGLKIIPGVEFDCWHKTDFLHILGYGMDINNDNFLKLCAKNRHEKTSVITRIFSARKAPHVIYTIKQAGGIAVLAHPACCWSLNPEKMIRDLIYHGLDGLEVYYPYAGHRGIVKFHSVEKIKKIAKKYQLLSTGGTDCHESNLVFFK